MIQQAVMISLVIFLKGSCLQRKRKYYCFAKQFNYNFFKKSHDIDEEEMPKEESNSSIAEANLKFK